MKAGLGHDVNSSISLEAKSPSYHNLSLADITLEIVILVYLNHLFFSRRMKE